MDSAALIAELNDAVAHGTVDQRTKILHRITKLFVVASAGYSDEQIELFDDVLMRVAATIVLSARAVMACLLAGPSARADITFCNQFPHLVYVAMAYPQNGGFLDFARLDLTQDRRMFIVRPRTAREDVLLSRRERRLPWCVR